MHTFTLEDFLQAERVRENGLTESVPKSYRCFHGAWYYKVLSAKDDYLGIEATITLPKFTPDPNRFEIVEDRYLKKQVKKYLDTPSVYLGGSSDHETDIGFGWFYGLVDGQVSDEKITFRPFWRTIFERDGKEVNEYKGTTLEEVEYYFYPGDTVKVVLYSPVIDFLRLSVNLVTPTTEPKYVEIRKSHEKEGKVTKSFLSPLIPAPGNGHHKTEYKRVNAIDQYHNEGKPTQATNAIVHTCTWQDVNLFSVKNYKLVKVPFGSSRSIVMQCPNPVAFKVKQIEEIEEIEITPSVV